MYYSGKTFVKYKLSGESLPFLYLKAQVEAGTGQSYRDSRLECWASSLSDNKIIYILPLMLDNEFTAWWNSFFWEMIREITSHLFICSALKRLQFPTNDSVNSINYSVNTVRLKEYLCTPACWWFIPLMWPMSMVASLSKFNSLEMYCSFQRIVIVFQVKYRN